MVEIRRALHSDLDWLWLQYRAFADFYNSVFDLAQNEDYGRAFLKNLIDNHVVFLSVEEGIRTGFIAGTATQHHFNPSIRQLNELGWWVIEDARGGKSGSRLLEEFIKFGKENCDWISFTMEANSPISDAPLLKRGFRLQEKTYLLECE